MAACRVRVWFSFVLDVKMGSVLPVRFYPPAKASCFWGPLSTRKHSTGFSGTFPVSSFTRCQKPLSPPHPWGARNCGQTFETPGWF